MKSIRLLAILCTLISVGSVKGQDSLQSLSKEKIPLSLSTYNINGLNPGLKLGLSYPLSEVVKYRVKRNRPSKTISKVLFLNISSAAAIEPLSIANWITSLEIGRRREKNKKWFTTPILGVGFITRYNLGETWENQDEELVNIGASSRTYLAPNIGMTLGRNLPSSSNNFGLYTRVNSVLIVGMNNTNVPLFSLEFGIRCTPSFSFSKPSHPVNKKN